MLQAFCKVSYLLRVAKMELKVISKVKTINKLKFIDSSHCGEKLSCLYIYIKYQNTVIDVKDI